MVLLSFFGIIVGALQNAVRIAAVVGEAQDGGVTWSKFIALSLLQLQYFIISRTPSRSDNVGPPTRAGSIEDITPDQNVAIW